MNLQNIRLAVADDHVLFRKTLISYLSREQNINIIFESSDGNDLMVSLKNHPVDVLLLDLFMPKVSGNDILTMIRSQYPDLKIIVLSMCTDISRIHELLDLGIYAYIAKSDEPQELINSIRAACSNRIYRNHLFTEALYFYRQKTITHDTRNQEVNFGERERKIIQLLWEEKSNKEIAEELFLSIRSIEKIRQEIKEKLKTKTIVGIIKYALAKKIIHLPKPNSAGSELILQRI